MRIIVAVDTPADLAVVDHAVAVARERHARIALIGGTPRLWLTSIYAMDCARLERELRIYAEELLRSAVARVDADIPVTLRQIHGRAADHLLGRHVDVPGDLLMIRGGRRLTARPRRRRQRVGTLLRVPVARRAARLAGPEPA